MIRVAARLGRHVAHVNPKKGLISAAEAIDWLIEVDEVGWKVMGVLEKFGGGFCVRIHVHRED